MIVKNIAVSDRKFFTEWLVRDLIQHQISYVQIENEFHFLEYIFRFYDMNEDKEQIIKLSGIGNVFDENTVVPSLFEIEEKNPLLGVSVAQGKSEIIPNKKIRILIFLFCYYIVSFFTTISPKI